ncbi:MAG: bifunctional shikimate kinase/3-dehydroquinate synthase, partial [Chloroflexota bacterium]|nr:bifunctional shikimate kinase/3-dehydroquinate synthase [Chloroflexota bacterium]
MTTGTPLRHVERIVLIGFSGTGKSTVARLVADRLGWDLVDTDAEIEAATGMSIAQFFERRGEAAFRAVERERVGASAARRGVVVATGGGAVVDPEVWSLDLLGSPGTLVVALDARSATILQRLREHRSSAGAAADRPLLASDDPLGRIAELKASRQHAYDRASITLVTDACSTTEVAAELTMLARRSDPDDLPDLRLETSSGVSSIYVAPGVSARIGRLLQTHRPTPPRAWIVSDDAVGPLHAQGVRQAIEQAGLAANVRTVPAGEGSKSLTGASVLYDWLLEAGIERGDVVVAVGGGMVGDLAGFVAATCLRGVSLVQVPTTLLAMVDSSVGGKTGINHRTGKNLIGAFYQPPLVLIDPTFLQTLPARELTSGWAEIVKHAIIQPSAPGGER